MIPLNNIKKRESPVFYGQNGRSAPSSSLKDKSVVDSVASTSAEATPASSCPSTVRVRPTPQRTSSTSQQNSTMTNTEDTKTASLQFGVAFNNTTCAETWSEAPTEDESPVPMINMEVGNRERRRSITLDVGCTGVEALSLCQENQESSSTPDMSPNSKMHDVEIKLPNSRMQEIEKMHGVEIKLSNTEMQEVEIKPEIKRAKTKSPPISDEDIGAASDSPSSMKPRVSFRSFSHQNNSFEEDAHSSTPTTPIMGPVIQDPAYDSQTDDTDTQPESDRPEADRERLDLLATKSEDYEVFATWSFSVFDCEHPDTQMRYATLMLRHYAVLCDPLHGVDTTPATIFKYIKRVRRAYNNNPYHTWEHALTVLHGTFMLLTEGQIERYLTPLDCYALVVAAAGHDLGHPGWSNDMESRVIGEEMLTQECEKRRELLHLPSFGTRRASTFSLLESFHALKTCEFMTQDGSRLLSTRAPEQVREEFRRMVVLAILATDMARHNELSASAKDRTKEMPIKPITSPASQNDRELIVRMTLHAADISNPFLNFQTSARWAQLIVQEMMMQKKCETVLFDVDSSAGDKQQQQDARTIMTMDAIAASQVFFVGEVALPFFENILGMFPDLKNIVEQGSCNLARWKDIKGGSPPPEGIFSEVDELDEAAFQRARQYLQQNRRFVSTSSATTASSI